MDRVKMDLTPPCVSRLAVHSCANCGEVRGLYNRWECVDQDGECSESVKPPGRKLCVRDSNGDLVSLSDVLNASPTSTSSTAASMTLESPTSPEECDRGVKEIVDEMFFGEPKKDEGMVIDNSGLSVDEGRFEEEEYVPLQQAQEMYDACYGISNVGLFEKLSEKPGFMAWDKYVGAQMSHLKANPREMKECKKIEDESVDKIASMFRGMKDYTWWESNYGTVYDEDKHMSTRAEYVREAQEIMNTIAERGGKLDFMPAYFRYRPRAESMAKKITELNVKNPAERDLLVANVAKEREIQYLTGVVEELNGKYNTLSTLLIPTLLHALIMLDDKDRELQLGRQDDIWLMLAVMLEASRRHEMFAVKERDEFEAKLIAQEKVIEDLERLKTPRGATDDDTLQQPRPLVERCGECSMLKLIEHRDIVNLWTPRPERETSTSQPTPPEPEATPLTSPPRTSTPKAGHVAPPPSPPPLDDMLDCSESFEEWNFEDPAFEGIAALIADDVDAVLNPEKEEDLPVSAPSGSSPPVVVPWSPCYNRRDIPNSPTLGTEDYLRSTPTLEEEDDDVICLEGYTPPFEQPTTAVSREEIVNSPARRARRDLLAEFRPDTPYRRRSTRLLRRRSPKHCP